MAAKETPNLIDSLEHNQLAQCELIDRCIDHMKKLTNENEAFGKRINFLIQKLDKTKTELIECQYLHKQSLKREEKYKIQYAECKEEKPKFNDEILKLCGDIESFSGENHILNDKLTSVIRQTETIKIERDGLQTQNECLRKQVIHLQKRLKNETNHNEFHWSECGAVNKNKSYDDSDIEIINNNRRKRKRSECSGIEQTNGSLTKKRKLN